MLKVSENIAFVLQTTLGSSFDNDCLFSPTTFTVKRAKFEDGVPYTASQMALRTSLVMRYVQTFPLRS